MDPVDPDPDSDPQHWPKLSVLLCFFKQLIEVGRVYRFMCYVVGINVLCAHHLNENKHEIKVTSLPFSLGEG